MVYIIYNIYIIFADNIYIYICIYIYIYIYINISIIGINISVCSNDNSKKFSGRSCNSGTIQPGSILEFKGSIWYVQKGHSNMVTQANMTLQNCWEFKH